MKLLIMGAGYVGMALLNSLQSQPDEISITTTQTQRIDELTPFGHVFDLSQRSEQDFKNLVDTCDGAIIMVAPKNSLKYEETYLQLAKKITAAIKNRNPPFYLLYTSSTSVYEGRPRETGKTSTENTEQLVFDTWVTEEMPLNPSSQNAKILLATEQLYLNCGAAACVLRLGGIYGPGRELDKRAQRLSAKEMPGTGCTPTNHIHLDDIIAAIQFCMARSLTGVYNLANDDHPSRQELYDHLCRSANIPAPIWNSPPSIEKEIGYKVSNQKIKHAGFTFKHATLTK